MALKILPVPQDTVRRVAVQSSEAKREPCSFRSVIKATESSESDIQSVCELQNAIQQVCAGQAWVLTERDTRAVNL